MAKRILFISHDAGRTGAPFVLLHLSRWLREHTDFEFATLIKKGGPLEDEFRALGPVHVHGGSLSGSGTPAQQTPSVPQRARRTLRRNVARLKRFLPLEAGRLRRTRAWAKEQRADLIVTNTVENSALVAALAPLGLPVVTHAHELEYWMRQHTGAAAMNAVVSQTTHFVAASRAVLENLVENHAVPRDHVTLVHECLPVSDWERRLETIHEAGVRTALGLGPDALVLGGAGTTDWRKGPDLFIQLARMVVARRPSLPVHFVWMGGDLQGRDFERLRHDIVHAGLKDRVHLLGVRTDNLSVLRAFDVFCLTSREDAYPLVVLESALVRRPVLCFQGAGGAPEFVRQDAGIAVPYLDLDALCGAAVELLEDPARRARMGEIGRHRVVTEHDVQVLGPRFANVLERAMAR